VRHRILDHRWQKTASLLVEINRAERGTKEKAGASAGLSIKQCGGD
jgi:hypothetical protein